MEELLLVNKGRKKTKKRSSISHRGKRRKKKAHVSSKRRRKKTVAKSTRKRRKSKAVRKHKRKKTKKRVARRNPRKAKLNIETKKKRKRKTSAVRKHKSYKKSKKRTKGGSMAKRKKKAGGRKGHRKHKRKSKGTRKASLKGRYRLKSGSITINKSRARAGIMKITPTVMESLWILGGFIVARVLGTLLQRFIKDSLLSQIAAALAIMFVPIKIPNKDKLATGAVINATLALTTKFLPASIKGPLQLEGLGAEVGPQYVGMGQVISETTEMIPGNQDVVEEIVVPAENVGGYHPFETSVGGYHEAEETVGDE